jgi:hypothetical protein
MRLSLYFRSREAGRPAVQDHPRGARAYLPAHQGPDTRPLGPGRGPAQALPLQEHGRRRKREYTVKKYTASGDIPPMCASPNPVHCKKG